jgi:hypothetical protein
MMFEGTYTTEFYRKIYKLVHTELELIKRGASTAELDEVVVAWRELRESESGYRSSRPTFVEKYYPTVSAPDLSKRWN